MSFNYQKTDTVAGHTGGDNRDIEFTFDYLDDDDIKVFKTDTSGTALVLGTNWQFQNKKQIRILNGTANVGTIANGDVFIIQRQTNVDTASVTYAPGSSIRAEDLNNNQLQALFSAQEREERSVPSTGGTVTGNVNIEAASIVFEGATPDAHETTVTAKDPTGDATITVPNLTGHIALFAVDPGSTTISSTPAELNKLDGYTGDHTDINKIDGVTDGTVTASKAVVVDANKDVTGFRNVTATGQIGGATGSFSSNVTVATPTADGHAATKAYVDGVALAAIPDSDKGDISVTGSGTTWTIDNDAVTYAKMQNVSATDRLLGRDTAGAGDVEEITPANVRTMLNVADGANNYTHPNHSGEVTSTADGATVIANDAVTYAKMQNVAANSILGNNTGSAADAIELTAAQVRTLAAAAGTGTVNTFSATQSVTPDVATSDTAIDMSLSNFIEVGSTNPTNTPTNLVVGTSGVFYADTAAPTSWHSTFKHPAGLYTAPTAFPAIAPWYIAETDQILVGSWTQGIA
jgi:hypothetical protein